MNIKKIKESIAALEKSNKPDGTYNITTGSPVEYGDGFQVSYCNIGDHYTPEEEKSIITRFRLASDDGIIAAGKYGGVPELSFHIFDEEQAVSLAKEYNQISIWAWNIKDEIMTGGTGRR